MFVLYNRETRARMIARELRVARFYPYEGRLLAPRNARGMQKLVNWGCVQYRFDDGIPVLNRDVRIAASKQESYACFQRNAIPCPTWTNEAQVAKAWNVQYLARRDGLSGGKSIHIYEPGAQARRAHDFYTRVIPARREFRLHVAGGNVIAVQKKLLANAQGIIHNHDNGVIFQFIPSDCFDIGRATTTEIQRLAIGAVSAVGLDFGAVDILQEEGTSRLYVLEVNSAPGIRTDSIYAAYLAYFRQFVQKES